MNDDRRHYGGLVLGGPADGTWRVHDAPDMCIPHFHPVLPVITKEPVTISQSSIEYTRYVWYEMGTDDGGGQKWGFWIPSNVIGDARVVINHLIEHYRKPRK